ncbi:hypothetical protein OG394_02645 [Kribbella sp. NBC_01245]|nr:hypothetical protein [Kribbella sp. NBC_01245]
MLSKKVSARAMAALAPVGLAATAGAANAADPTGPYKYYSRP